MQELAEPGDDEQRIVDPDSEPDHRHEDRRDRVDVGEPGEDEEQEERGRDGADRERDRNRRSDERPEHDQEHDERGQEAERLRGPLLDRWELGLAVVLDGYSRRLDCLPHRVLDVDDGVAVLVVDDPVELRLRIGDPAVLGEGVRCERVGHARESGLVLGRLELGRPELGDRLLDRRLAGRRVETLPLGRREDDVQDAALLRRELGLDQVGRPLCVGARDLELVAKAPADRADEHDQNGDDPHPGADHTPWMGGIRTRPACESAGGQALVSREPLGARSLGAGRSLGYVGHASSP